MRALFIGLPAHGHTNPTLPLVRELTDRGHDVVYATTDAFADAIRAAGARFHPYASPRVVEFMSVIDRLDQLPWLLMRATAEVFERDLDAFRAVRPDVVISDSVAIWGPWVAAALQVPCVSSVTTFAMNRHLLGYAAKTGVRPKSAALLWSKLRHIAKAFALARKVRRKYRVRAPSLTASMFAQSDLSLVFTSTFFQPWSETFPDTYRFIGPAFGARTADGADAWAPSTSRPRVYVSMGTLFNADARFYRDCFEAFAGEPIDVLMAVGRRVDIGALGAPPANIMVRSFVAQLDVLAQAAVFVTHGGMNSVSESLAHVVPMVVIPQMSEQAIVGKRVEELGAGVCLGASQVTPETLREAVRRVLAERSFKDASGRIGESFRSAGGVVRGVDAIEALMARARP